jgi:hypothetical protein
VEFALINCEAKKIDDNSQKLMWGPKNLLASFYRLFIFAQQMGYQCNVNESNQPHEQAFYGGFSV